MHLYFSAFISAVIHHYLLLLDFIWQALINDSIVVKGRWQADFVTLSGFLDAIWLLPSSRTSCVLDKIQSTCLTKWTLTQVSLKNFCHRFLLFLTNGVTTPSLPWVTKMLLSLTKLVCQRTLRGLFVFRCFPWHYFLLPDVDWFSCGFLFMN